MFKLSLNRDWHHWVRPSQQHGRLSCSGKTESKRCLDTAHCPTAFLAVSVAWWEQEVCPPAPFAAGANLAMTCRYFTEMQLTLHGIVHGFSGASFKDDMLLIFVHYLKQSCSCRIHHPCDSLVDRISCSVCSTRSVCSCIQISTVWLLCDYYA